MAGTSFQLFDAGPPRINRCMVNGTRSGSCRTMGERCDEGLVCRVARCVTAIAVGAECCDSIDERCVEGANCVAVGRANICVTDGALNGRGREGGVCDAGLTCSGLYCAM